MERIDLSNYGLVYKKPQRILERRGVLDSDALDLPHQIANKFNTRYCDYGASLCLYEQFTEIPSFYGFLLVKNRSVLDDSDVLQHKSIYELEKKVWWNALMNMKGRQIKEFIAFTETEQKAFNHFVKYIHDYLTIETNTYYWVKLNITINNIPLIQEELKGYCINAINMPNEANILVLFADPQLTEDEIY